MAESPSELQAEVEKLERKHAENPEGRYFVPLANDYRKMGELERAEALLRAGLQKHPDYLSAHIVLGRCLADRGATSEAADEFTYVLSMDPQNLIALRSLGELAAAEGRRDDAGRWYRELLAVDPMNEDARRAIEQLDAPQEAAPEPPSAEAGAWWEATDEDEDDAEQAAAAIGLDAPGAGPEDAVEEAADDLSRAASAGGAEPDGDPYGAFLDIDTSGVADDRPADGDEQPEYGMMELNANDDESGYEDPGADEIEPVEVVTETIAELYARQGLHELAADVYRELIRRRGGDPSLERRLQELEGTLAESESERPAEDPFAASFAEGFADEGAATPEESWAPAAGETAEQETGAGAWDAIPEAPAEQETGPPSWMAAGEEPADQPSSGAPASSVAAEPWAAAAEPGAEQEAAGPDAPAYKPAAEEEAAPAAAGAGPRTGGRTIGGYLSSLAAWTPSAAEREPQAVQIGAEEVTEIEASPAAETFVGGEQPADPFPWEVPGDEGTQAGSGGAAAEEPARGIAADSEPVAEPEPTAGAEPSAPFGLEPSPAEELPGPGDLEPEPSIELEDYFPADEAEAPAEPAQAASPPPAAGGDASAAQEDDDLESFQAWLRSLKR